MFCFHVLLHFFKRSFHFNGSKLHWHLNMDHFFFFFFKLFYSSSRVRKSLRVCVLINSIQKKLSKWTLSESSSYRNYIFSKILGHSGRTPTPQILSFNKSSIHPVCQLFKLSRFLISPYKVAFAFSDEIDFFSSAYAR